MKYASIHEKDAILSVMLDLIWKRFSVILPYSELKKCTRV